MFSDLPDMASEIQDQFDRGLINSEEFNARWDEQMVENETSTPRLSRWDEWTPVLHLDRYELFQRPAHIPIARTLHVDAASILRGLHR